MIVTPDFGNRLTFLNDRIKDMFRFWQVHSPHYTDHGESHCESVEGNLDELISDEIKQEMNEYEIFFLLAAVWLHDVGIMCAKSRSETNNEIREKHHERSRKFVVEKLKDLLDGPERYVIGEICFAHRDIVPIEQIEKIKTVRHRTLGNKDIRVQFLAALLRLSDSCDLCHTRTSKEAMSISKPPPQASFYHSLHERVSGIKFDSKEHLITVDLNVKSKKEKKLCQRYIVAALRSSLNSIRDCLTRNNVAYVDVIPKYSVTQTIASKLSAPQEIIEKIPSNRVPKVRKYELKAWSLFREGKSADSMKILEEGLKKNPNSISLWRLKSTFCQEMNRKAGHKEALDNLLRLDANDRFTLGDAGHFYGEQLLDYKTSFEYLEKAYQAKPEDRTASLNYAEALVTVGRYEDANNLATKMWRWCTEQTQILNAQLIRVYSAFFLRRRKYGLKELRKLFLFITISPPSLVILNSWVYNKITKYINESSLAKDVKKALTSIINLASRKITIKRCEKELQDLK
jgi:tetratricopeptide (TPR) repeat protein